MSELDGRTLQAAIIGCGSLGHLHASCLHDLGVMEPVAYCDVVPERAQVLLDKFGGRTATDDVDRIFDDPAVDVVYVTTRHDSHADLCVRAMEANKHVMVEKPLAMTVADCLRVGDAVTRTGRTLMVAFKFRYFDMVRKAKELIAEPLVVSMQMMDQRWPDDHWANDPVSGGGNVLSQGCHATDLLRFLAGRDPIDVYASGANFYQPAGGVDNLAAVFRFDDDVTGSWLQGDADSPPVTSKFFVQMFAEGRSLTLTDRLTTLTYHERGCEPVVYRGSETGVTEENVELATALSERRSPDVGVDDGLYATAMVLQAFHSLETRQPEPLRALLARQA